MAGSRPSMTVLKSMFFPLLVKKSDLCGRWMRLRGTVLPRGEA